MKFSSSKDTSCGLRRDVFRIQSNIYDGAFFAKTINVEKALFSLKNSIVDVRLGSKYDSATPVLTYAPQFFYDNQNFLIGFWRGILQSNNSIARLFLK